MRLEHFPHRHEGTNAVGVPMLDSVPVLSALVEKSSVLMRVSCVVRSSHFETAVVDQQGMSFLITAIPVLVSRLRAMKAQ